MTNLAAAVELVAKWRKLAGSVEVPNAPYCLRKCADDLETILAELGRLQSPPVAGLAELTDEQWVKLFIKMDEAFTGVDDEHCVPLIAKAAREFLGKVDG